MPLPTSAALIDVTRPRSHPVTHLVDDLVKRLGLDGDFGADESLAHVERVSSYAEVIARRLGIGRGEATAICAAARLHDIGKVAIPSRLLNRPARLSASEMRIVESHTIIGHALLAESGIADLEIAAEIARFHHERWDGSGYPDGLAGEDIPVSARIVAVADAFDALTTNRVYRSAFPITVALQIMEDGRGTQFDPEVLAAFISNRRRMMSILEHIPDPA